MNREKQNLLKIQDLEATIIKFGDEKNQAWDNLKENEDFFKKEIAELQEKLAQKDQGFKKENFEYNDKLKQTEDYYLQSILFFHLKFKINFQKSKICKSKLKKKNMIYKQVN